MSRVTVRHFLDEYSRRLRPWQQQALSDLIRLFLRHDKRNLLRLFVCVLRARNEIRGFWLIGEKGR